MGVHRNTALLRWFGDQADCLPEVALGPGGHAGRDRDSPRRYPTPDCRLGFGFRLRLAIPKNDGSRTRHGRQPRGLVCSSGDFRLHLSPLVADTSTLGGFRLEALTSHPAAEIRARFRGGIGASLPPAP